MSEIRYIIELKLKNLWKQYRKFQEVGNKTAMHDYSCKINILEHVLEDADEANDLKTSDSGLNLDPVMVSVCECINLEQMGELSMTKCRNCGTYHIEQTEL